MQTSTISSHELNVKSFINENWSCKTRRNFKTKKNTFWHIKEDTASLTFDKEVNIWTWMRCLKCVFSLSMTRRLGKKIIFFSPGAYPRMGRIRNCFLPPQFRGSLAKNPYPGEIPVKAKHKTDSPNKESVWSLDHFILQLKLSIHISEEHILVKLFSFFHKYKLLISDANNVFAKIGYSWNHTQHEKMITTVIIHINPINH